MFQLYLNVFVHTLKVSGMENNLIDIHHIEKKYMTFSKFLLLCSTEESHTGLNDFSKLFNLNNFHFWVQLQEPKTC